MLLVYIITNYYTKTTENENKLQSVAKQKDLTVIDVLYNFLLSIKWLNCWFFSTLTAKTVYNDNLKHMPYTASVYGNGTKQTVNSPSKRSSEQFTRRGQQQLTLSLVRLDQQCPLAKTRLPALSAGGSLQMHRAADIPTPGGSANHKVSEK